MMVFYSVVIELIISAVYIYKMLEGNLQADFFSIFILLFYFCLKLLFQIFDQKKMKLAILILANLLILICIGVNSNILLFFLLSFSQLLSEVGLRKPYIALVGLCFVSMIDNRLLFILISVFSFICYQVLLENVRLYEKSLRDGQALKDEKQRAEKMFLEIERNNKSELYRVKLEERARIMQNMHDEVGHTITANIMRLEAVKYLTKQDKVKVEMSTIADNLRVGMDNIRKIIRDLKPQETSLNITSIKKMVSDIVLNKAIDITLDYTSDISVIKEKEWEVIYLNIKEALTNMIKFSNAKVCRVDFVKLNKALKVSIKDDGTGCKNIVKGVGLSGMEKRIKEVGANIIFDGSDGFSIVMLFDVGQRKEKHNL